MSKSESLVDSFVFCEKFNKAKSAIDKVNKNSANNNNLLSLQKDVSNELSNTNHHPPLPHKYENTKKSLKVNVKPKEDNSTNEQDMSMIRAGHEHDHGMSSSRAAHELLMSSSRHAHEQDMSMIRAGHEHDHGMSTIISLSKCHSKIYEWFIDQGITGLFSKPEIQRSLNLPYITVRRAIRKFEISGIIELHHDKHQKITEYKINTKINVRLFKMSMIRAGHEHDQSTITNSTNSSSSYINKNTTTKMDALSKILKTDPELGYWRQKKLTVKQIENWIDTAGCTTEIIFKYLKYCRFEMVNLNIEKTKDIRNVFDWFFKILERTGSYPKPKGYKSYQELNFEREKELVEQEERATKQEKELYQRKIKAEKDKKFWKMMNNSEGECYKKCLDLLNPIQKKSKGSVFEEGMKGVFEEHFS